MNDLQREKFEELLKAKLHLPCSDGDYCNPETQSMWQVWQAAIQSVVVELPFEDSSEMHSGAVCAALDKAGIKYE